MSIVFVTVGTSAVENEEIWESRRESNRKLKAAVPGDPRKFVRGLEQGEIPPPELKRLLLDAHRSFWTENDNFRDDFDNRRLTSAEAISTHSARRLGMFGLCPGQDKVVLLLSKTPIGELCGRINEQIFRSHLFYPGVPGASDVVTETIETLNAEGFRLSEKKARPIYPQILEIVQRYMKGRNEHAYFNITGSYKGVIPPVTHISIKEYPKRSTILYMHESMDAAVRFNFSDPTRPVEEVIDRDNPYVPH